jgi:hypothetical protein
VILWNTKSFQKAPLSAALPSHLYHLLCLGRQALLNLEPVLDQILRPHLERRPLVVITTYTCKGDHWIHSGSLGFTTVLTGNALRNTRNFTTTNPRSSRALQSPQELYTNALPFQTIALDFITKLPISEGYDTILTITDHDCSKASLFIPCKETIDLEGIAQLFAQHVVPHYGIPRKIILDRDTRFTSNFTTELCRILGIKQNISTAYHPQTDGQSERTNQSLEQYLRLVCTNDQKAWARWLSMAQYIKNSWPSSTTKKTPFELLLGYTPTIYQPTQTSLVPGVTDRL